MTAGNGSVGDYKLASTAAGFTLGFGFLVVWEAIKQTRAVRSPLRSVYIYMVWGEIVVNLAIAVIAWLFLDGTLSPTVPVLFMILFLWVFEVQLLMQIIINRIAIVCDNHRLIRRIKWGTVLIITLIEIAVFIIWIPAHLNPPPFPVFVKINTYWDRTSKVLILLVDAGLNYFFLRVVNKRLVNYHGLTKYKPLVSFNAKLMVVSISMDLMLICLMSLKNQVVYTQFHPVAYIVKLNIEMSMASLITKLARNSIDARNNEFLGDMSSSRNPSHTATHQSIGLRSGVHTSAVGKQRKESIGDDFQGIRTFKEVNVKVETVPEGNERSGSSDSGVEGGFDGRTGLARSSSKGRLESDDELPLAQLDAVHPVQKKRLSWK